MKDIVRQIIQWLKKWFWSEPVKEQPIKATQVVHNYKCIEYNGQLINLKDPHEVKAFEAMSRKDKRSMARKFASQEKKGYIKFIEIDGHMTCVRNKDYEQRAIDRK